eukprot:GHVL01002442.1.p1 GENE.GHVL01002442.1~~GHVL01002442.1.p1  ORF type:complete len:540 (+),score=157.34 GHVL01002442.1:43-1662(+)
MEKLEKIKNEKSSKKTQDPRFSTKKDPRFRKMPKKMKKTEIDQRFKKVLDKNSAFAVTHMPDKRGKKVRIDHSKELKKLYSCDEKTDEDVFVWNEQSSEEEAEEDPIMEQGTSDIWNTIEKDVPVGGASSRLAVMNCDWRRCNAVDILVLAASVLDQSKQTNKKSIQPMTSGEITGIKNVSIHCSDFGKEKLKEENMKGPQLEGLLTENEKAMWDEKQAEMRAAITDLDEDESKMTDFNEEIMRRYQKQTLKYYYAVITTSDPTTATLLYDELDGLETAISPIGFDCRFVPEDVKLEDSPTSFAKKIPESYRAPLTVNDRALQHSRVSCDWDKTPEKRKSVLMTHLTKQQISDLDFEAYLASDSSDEDEETVVQLAKKRREELLGDDFDEETVMDVAVNLKSALDVKTNEETEDLGPWQKYLEKRKNQKKEKRKKRKEQVQEPEEVSSIPADIADLQLLSENSKEVNHFNIRQRKEKKGKKDVSEDPFEVNLNDPRLSKVFTDPSFSIDPTSSNFTNSLTNKIILKEKRDRSRRKFLQN